MKCLYPECKGKVTRRGLCGSCYVTAWKLVKSGAATWEKLIKRGKALECGRKGRPGEKLKWFLSK